MWRPRQVTHLPPVCDLLLPLVLSPDRRDQRLIVYHPKETALWGKLTCPSFEVALHPLNNHAPQGIPISNVNVFTPNMSEDN